MASDPILLGSTPMALIRAAEVLIGQYGIDGVSVRKIYAAAQISNKSAIAYYFGDKTDLVNAIWRHRLPTLELRRRTMMLEPEAADLMDFPATWVRLLIQPLFDLVDEDGRRTYAAFFRQAMRSPELVQLRNEATSRTPTSADLFDRLGRHATITPDELALRFRVLSCAFCDLIAEHDAATERGLPVKTDAEFMRDAVEMVMGGCALPPVPPKLR